MPDGSAAPAARWPGAAPEAASTSLVGRRRELGKLSDLVRSSDTRLATLVGVGGVGKSRLAAEIAERELATFGGRVAFVALDGVSDASLVLPAIAGSLSVADDPGSPLSEALARELGAAPSLLVLDTLEHVRPAAPDLADLVERTPGLRILATSRIALGVPRERVVWVEPLPLPDPSEADPAALERNPATALFLVRALAVRPDFEVTPATTELVTSICRRVDGIPLAIELAAAALRVLPPHQLLDQLADRLAEPTAGAFDAAPAPARQRSLRATMDWSVGLLSRPVARLYRRIGVLAGGFDPETAAAVLEGGDRRGLAPLGIDVAVGLQDLADASLVRSAATPRGTQHSLLTTVRADALARLEHSGEAVAMRWAHAHHVLSLAESAERELPTEREVDALDRVEAAHDDIREALEWAMDRGDGAFAARLAGSLAEFWRTRGYLTEGRLRLAAALALAGDAPPPVLRKALAGAGLLASYQGDHAPGAAYLGQALELARADDDRASMAAILNWLGTNSYGAGKLDEAERYIVESLVLRRALGDDIGAAASLNALGGVHHFRGDLDRARETFRESLELKRRAANPNSIAVSLMNLGLVERDAGQPEAASDAFTDAIDIWTRTGDRQRMAVGLHNAALVELDRGRHAEAADLLDRAWATARELGDRTEMAYARADRIRVDVERGDLEGAARAASESLPRSLALGSRVIVPLALEGAAAVIAARGDDASAARLWAAAATERVDSGFANMPADAALVDARITRARARLGDDRWASAWAEGSTWTASQAVGTALAVLAGEPSGASR